MRDTSKLCIHTMTTKPWDVEQAIEAYSRVGVGGITVWRQALEGRSVKQVARYIQDAGLKTVSLCRGGFFPSTEPGERRQAVEDNLRAIDQAAELNAPLLVLVCGSHPAQPLRESRQQILDGIAALLPHAHACGVKLGIEPLHPMYADTRSAINTMSQANDLCEVLDSPLVGVVVDVYHLWWDSNLEREIVRSGRNGRLFAFHICDWKIPTQDMLFDRGLMGEGCIPIPQIRKWVEDAGFNSFYEVEIFSNHYWSKDQEEFLKEILEAFRRFS